MLEAIHLLPYYLLVFPRSVKIRAVCHVVLVFFPFNIVTSTNLITIIIIKHFSFSGIDFKIKTVELRGKKIKLQIWDTGK